MIGTLAIQKLDIGMSSQKMAKVVVVSEKLIIIGERI